MSAHVLFCFIAVLAILPSLQGTNITRSPYGLGYPTTSVDKQDVSCKFDFEDGLDGWERTGSAFNNQPTYGDNPTARNRGQPANQQGNWWIGGYENRPSNVSKAGLTQGDGPQGTITSPSFVITGNKVSFLIGGGCDMHSVRAELIVDHKVVRRATGNCHETMTRKFWEVGDFIGQRAQVKLVDFSSRGWGHINFDDLKGDISCSIPANTDKETLVKLVKENFKPGCKFDFEGGLDGWDRTGSAFNNQPTYGDNPTARNRGQAANQQGDWWIGGYESRPSTWEPAGRVQGDGPQGTLTSPSFDIQGNYISFLIGGGCDINSVRAELVVDHKVVRRATGSCHETMSRKFWYVGDFIGQRAQVKLIDFSSRGWGHINFDDLKGDISCTKPENTASCKIDFEEGIDGWHRTGSAFDNQPTYGDNPTARHRGQPANQHGNWWIGGAESRPAKYAPAGRLQGDGPQGTLTTPSFTVTGKYISFLIGGGCDINSVRAELIIDHKVVRRATGRCHETMTRKFWKVGKFIGQRAEVKLVDFSSRGWGHINFDDLKGDIDCTTPENTEIFSKALCKFDFEEDGLDGWVRTGTAFDNQPTYGDNPTARNRGQPANQHGDWWIGGAEHRPSRWATAGRVQLDGPDKPQGTLTSPSFDIQGNYISFLIGGGCDINTVRAELIVDNRVVKNATGNCHETMTRKSWYVGDLIGHRAQVRLVDFSSVGWGHINFDDMKGDITCTNYDEHIANIVEN